MQVEARRTQLTAGLLTVTLVAAGLFATTLASRSSGQGLRVNRIQSGLYTFPGRHTARVTVAELGGGRAAARVAITLRDATDKVVAHTDGVLRAGQPVRLDFQVEDVLSQLRATVSIAGASSRPATTMEDIDADGFTVIPKVACGPPSGRDSPQFFCPEWEATSFVQ
jgi:hypothetical protein